MDMVVVEDCSVDETTGAQSSMQNLRTERSWRKYIMRHACLRVAARQDYLTAILLPLSLM